MQLTAVTRMVAAGFTTLLLAAPASAAILYDQDVTPNIIFGSGNANGSFTVDRENGVELGLRGKLRHNASGAPENTFNSNGDGTYSFDAGVAPTQSAPTAVWSVEWSINSDYDDSTGLGLNDLSYRFGVDNDATQGTNFSVSDIINVTFADHAIGTNSTGNGAGAVAGSAGAYGLLIEENNVAQNSWKAHWILDSSFDPTVDGTYDFYLEAYGAAGLVARSQIQVIVGQGGAAVPAPAGLGLLGLGLLGLGARRRSRR